jgi:hypothetical protein
MPKYLADNPDLGEFIVVDEKPHPNGAKMVEGFFEGAPGEPLCGVCECRLEPHINDAGKRFRPRKLSDAKSLRGDPFQSLAIVVAGSARHTYAHHQQKTPASCRGFSLRPILNVQCKPPKSQINRMIGKGIPISHSKRPRPISCS